MWNHLECLVSTLGGINFIIPYSKHAYIIIGKMELKLLFKFLFRTTIAIQGVYINSQSTDQSYKHCTLNTV